MKEDLLIRVAELYYQQGLSQKEIADIIEMSRPSVSRLLDEAKESGIVEIIIHSAVRKNPQLSNQLREALGLREAIVVAGDYDYERGLKICGEAAAAFLGSVLENNQTLGISWGPATKYFCEAAPEREYYNVNVVQMVGCLGTGNPEVDGLELAMRLSGKLKGTYSNIYAPVFVDNELVHSYLIAQTQIASTLRRATQTDVIFTGIGSIGDEQSTLQLAGYITDEDRAQLDARGCAGHLLARFFDDDGREMRLDNLHTISAPLECMSAARWSVGIAATEKKARAALAAVRGGYLNTLIVDESLSRRLLALAAKR